jgi:hypothetical protein
VRCIPPTPNGLAASCSLTATKPSRDIVLQSLSLLIARSFRTGDGDSVEYNSVEYNSVEYNSVEYNSVEYNSVEYNSISAIELDPGQQHLPVCLEPLGLLRDRGTNRSRGLVPQRNLDPDVLARLVGTPPVDDLAVDQDGAGSAEDRPQSLCPLQDTWPRHLANGIR